MRGFCFPDLTAALLPESPCRSQQRSPGAVLAPSGLRHTRPETGNNDGADL